ncbi:MAG TPA: multiubiquitin domain-containing protein [Bryobacteraceae bacterium]|nr:multiubiquitin domain-containing protein [Bryobacteraceae bacterium]
MSEQEHKHEVRIHIDQHPYESPNPTTGAALYALGNVPAGLELYREVSGDREDKPIENGPEVVHLKEDEHFHSGPPKTYTIYVNGEQKVVTTKTVSFAEIAKLAYPIPPTGDNILYTVSYEDGPPANPQGSMKEGETVKVKNGMIFNVTATDKS